MDVHDTSTDESSRSTDESDREIDGANISGKIYSRKRLRKTEQWKRNKRKCLRNRGKEYVNSKGVIVPPRMCGKDCKCSLRCFEKVPQVDRARILKEFNNLASFDIQNAYLHGLIHGIEPKRRYTTKGVNSKRKKTFVYYVRLHGKEMRVCQAAFCSIHGISVKRIRNIRVKDCTPPIDQRGRHDNRPSRTPENSIECVKAHISFFHIRQVTTHKQIIPTRGIPLTRPKHQENAHTLPSEV